MIKELQNLKNKYDSNRQYFKFREFTKEYAFHFIENEINDKYKLLNNFHKSHIVFINSAIITQGNQDKIIFYICFKKTIIIIEKSSLLKLHFLFSSKTDIDIYFFPQTKDHFEEIIKIQYTEIHSFWSEYFDLSSIGYEVLWEYFNKSDTYFRHIFYPCAVSISFHQVYGKYSKNRIENFVPISNNNSNFDYNDKDCIKKKIDKCRTYLYYDFKTHDFIIQKGNYDKIYLLREINNYLSISHPFVPKFIGSYEDKYKTKYLFIEYIKGTRLSEIDKLKLNENDKFTIIFELLMLFEYLHDKRFIHRGLNPHHILIDKDNTIVLISFSFMIHDDDDFEADEGPELYMAPESYSRGIFSSKSDVFMIANMISIILTEHIPKRREQIKNYDFGKYTKITELFRKCIDDDPNKRPFVSDLIYEFFIEYYPLLENKLQSLLEMHEKYFNNLVGMNSIIGFSYSRGLYIPLFRKKITYFLSFSADRNDIESQYKLGMIYYEANQINHDINKAIHYLTLAANQNHCKSQFQLGLIYHKSSNINKAIHYLTLAADQNDVNSQYLLGVIYNDNHSTFYDIDKAIYYFSLAAKQNHIESYYNLGCIYQDDKYNQKNINKSIDYYLHAANLNHVKSQCNLGMIYLEGKDINKAINFFTSAANQNDSKAQFNLGLIYYDNVYQTRDIKKSIHYFSLAASQGHQNALLFLKSIQQ